MGAGPARRTPTSLRWRVPCARPTRRGSRAGRARRGPRGTPAPPHKPRPPGRRGGSRRAGSRPRRRERGRVAWTGGGRAVGRLGAVTATAASAAPGGTVALGADAAAERILEVLTTWGYVDR